MPTRSIEARLLAHEALLTALVSTHPKPQDAFIKFSQIYQAQVRHLNQSSPDNVQLAKELHSECDRFGIFFAK